MEPNNNPGKIASILSRLRVFGGKKPSEPSEGNPTSRPLEEIPGTKANFEAAKTPPQAGQGEKKG